MELLGYLFISILLILFGTALIIIGYLGKKVIKLNRELSDQAKYVWEVYTDID